MNEWVAANCGENFECAASILANDSTLVGASDPKSFGATPMIHATTCGDRRLIVLLLDAGADLNQRSGSWAGTAAS